MAFDLEKIDLGSFGINEEEDQQQVQLNANMTEAVKVNPDQHAQTAKLSKESGVPAFAVESNPEQVQQKLKLDQINLEGMTGRSPGTAKFLTANMDNPIIAQEDVMSGVLEGIERTFRGIGRSIGIGFELQGRGLMLKGVESDANESRVSFEEQGRRRTLSGFGDMSNRVDELIPSQALPSRFGFDARDLSEQFAASFGIETDEQLNALKKSASDRLIGEITDLQKERQNLTPEDLNIVQEGVRAGVESLANMAPGIGLAVLSGGGAAPVLMTIGAQTFSRSYGESRADGLTPEEARWFASIDAAIEVGTEILPTGTLERMMTGQSRGLKKDALKFVVQEMGTEQLATALQTVNSFMFGLDEELENAETAEEIISIQLRRQAVTAIATIVAGGAQITAATAVNKTINKLTETEQNLETQGDIEQRNIDALNADAAKSKLRERDVESFKQFVRDADGENNTHVYIDAVQTSLYLQGKTREEIEADPALKALRNASRESRATGADVAIPVDEFAGDIVGTDTFTELRDSMTMSDETISPFRQEQHRVETEAYVETLMAEAQENASEYVEAQEIYTTVRDQLIDTGAVNAANASVMAQIVPAWATAQARRTGRTVAEVYETAGLTIEGPQTGELARLEGEQVLSQGRVKAFHGTGTTFTDFDESKLGSFTGAESAGKGFFFTSSKELADQFRTEAERQTADIPAIEQAISDLTPEEITALYTEAGLEDITPIDPEDMDQAVSDLVSALEDELGESGLEERTGIDSVIRNKIGDEHFTKGETKEVDLQLDNPLVVTFDPDAEIDEGAINNAIEEAQQAGNDGVIFKDMKDAAVVSEHGEGAITSDVFFVFDKGQISQQGEQFAQPAFHGTPHKFDEFSLDAIGTGEGAQAFGWGMYFAGRRNVAEWYRDLLTKPHRDQQVANKLEMPQTYETVLLSNILLTHDDDINSAVGELEGYAVELRKDGDNTSYNNLTGLIELVREKFPEGGVLDLTEGAGQLYQVDIPEDSELIDYDAPLDSQGKFTTAIRIITDDKRGDGTFDEYAANNEGGGFREWSDNVMDDFTDKEISLMLNEKGVRGLRFRDSDSRIKGVDGTHTYVIWDESVVTVEAVNDELRKAELFAQQGEQPDTGAARGYYDPANSVIRLTESADLSTFLHEFAHFMYEMEASGNTEMNQSINNWYKRNAEDVAAEASKYLNGEYDPLKQGDRSTESQQTVTEADVVNYLDSNSTGSTDKDAAVRRAVHEQFARGFETYLMEGKAPSIELRNAFRTFARWLAQIYQALRGDLNVKLDAEMRQVFDRLLATEDQIAAAESRARVEPMFTDAAMAGMTEEEFSDYQQRQEKVKDIQTETLRDQMIKVLTRKTKQWWKEERADIVDEEMTTLRDEQVYSTAARLRDGDIKLDHATVKEMVGEERTDKLRRKSIRVSDKLRGMTAKGQAGVHPDEAAAFFGYNSGSEMLADLMAAPPIKETAEANAEALMVERHGDVFTDGTIERQADEAVQNEERGKLILHELRILARGTNQRTLDAQTMKSIAAEQIGNLSFREIHPGKYRKAEIKAAQESARMLAEGNKEGSAQAKTRQALNYYLGMAATDAKNETVKIVDRMNRYNKKKVREEIQKAEGGYWDQIVKILERFEFRKSATLTDVDRVNQDINTWAQERMDVDGDGLVLHNAVLNESYVTHWKNVAYSDLQGINDSVKNIEHVARYANKMTRMGEEIEFNKLVERLVSVAAETGTGRFKKSASAADDVSWIEKKGRWAMAQMTKIPYMMSWMDGLDRAGTWFTTFSQPMTDAYNAELELFEEVGKPVTDMIKNRSKEDERRHNTTFFIPEIKGTADGTHTGNLKGHEIVAVALNTGNEGNLRKLLLGEQWATEDTGEISLENDKLQAVLKHMTKSDWQMVQKIWDQIDILYPKLAEVHRRTTGLVPPKVDATPVVTEFGTFRGGYYPVKYDPTRDNKAAEFEERRDAEVGSMFASNASIQASVNTGATNERTGYFAPIHLTLNVVPNHIQETIHFITHHDAVREVNRLLRDPRVKKAVTEKLGPEEFAQLKPWLNDIAKDGRNAPNKTIVDAMFNKLRLGTTLGVMGFKASTGIIQISGLSNTIAEVGLGPVYESMRTILGSVDSMQSAWEFALEKSKVLKHRTKTMDREMMNAMQQLESKRGALAAVQEASMKHIALIQTYMVDLPSWHAAYIKELGESGDEAKAFQYADWVIENVQGSGATKDMAALMRNQTKTHTIFTMFMTFFSALWNLQRDLVKGASSGKHPSLVSALRNLPRDIVTSSGKYSTTTVAAKAMFLFTIPVLFEMMMRGEFAKEDEEPEELLQKTLTKIALYPIASVPFVRDVVNGVAGGYGYNASPVTSIVEQGLQGLEGASKAVLADGELTKGQIKSISKLAGATVGLPGTGQAWATGEHLFDVFAEGEEFTTHQLLFGPERK